MENYEYKLKDTIVFKWTSWPRPLFCAFVRQAQPQSLVCSYWSWWISDIKLIRLLAVTVISGGGILKNSTYETISKI